MVCAAGGGDLSWARPGPGQQRYLAWPGQQRYLAWPGQQRYLAWPGQQRYLAWRALVEEGSATGLQAAVSWGWCWWWLVHEQLWV
jgi:hypothetical protein